VEVRGAGEPRLDSVLGELQAAQRGRVAGADVAPLRGHKGRCSRHVKGGGKGQPVAGPVREGRCGAVRCGPWGANHGLVVVALVHIHVWVARYNLALHVKRSLAITAMHQLSGQVSISPKRISGRSPAGRGRRAGQELSDDGGRPGSLDGAVVPVRTRHLGWWVLRVCVCVCGAVVSVICDRICSCQKGSAATLN